MPRAVGVVLGSMCVGAGMDQAGAPAWIWYVMLAFCALWPHVAYQLSRRAAAPFEAECRNLVVDSLMGGVWVAAMGFNLLPSVLVLAALAMNNLAAAGVPLFVRGMVAQGLGMVAAGWVLQTPFQPESSFATQLWCVPFLLCYPMVLGAVTYRLSIELAQRKHDLLLERRRADEASRAEARALAELASRDELTGLYNRRHMNEVLQRLQAGQRGADGFALALVDLDRFKGVNDSHGHAAGDRVLQAFAERARQVVRDSDLIGRWGGEEFIIVFPGGSAEVAAAVAERLRAHVAAAPVSLPDGKLLDLTVSIGLARYRPGESVETAVERADHAMYRAKSEGRNRVVAEPRPATEAR